MSSAKKKKTTTKKKPAKASSSSSSSASSSSKAKPKAAAPTKAAPAAATASTARGSSSGKAGRPVVLLVDDFPDAREMYVEYLDFSGFDSSEASNGEEAIEKALELRPAVILMDLAMPVMDGWEATRRLKADPRTRKIPVIAVTGHALEGDAERARKAGCDGVISKPCLPQDLVSEVRRAIAARGPS